MDIWYIISVWIQGMKMYVYLGINNLPNGVISWLQMDMADGDSSLDDMGGIAEYGDEFGKMGTYVEKIDIKIDWTQCTQHGIERMNQRGMTKELVDGIVANGKTLSQCFGSKFAFITKEGVAIVSKEGKLITAWSSMNFDENMLEIIRCLFGK